ncbi:MAG: DUF1232 domain-containing protein [Bacteroidales bacterium]|nr:DUF1232 domain-containing protein [Bacteroidales bacterium]
MTNNSNQFALLWDKVRDYSKKVGRVAARPVVLLYFVMTDPQTPRSDKVAIGAALAYLILPIDLISAKRHPIFGWTDELTSVAIITKKVRHLITPSMEMRVDEQLDKWFGPATQDAVEVND